MSNKNEKLKFYAWLDYLECFNSLFEDEDPQEFQRIQQEIENRREADSGFDIGEINSGLYDIKSYPEYLASDHWQETRGKKLASTNELCESCGEKATQIHHKHYNSKYNEKLTDLESLCESCHNKIHGRA